jgi:hypothetical protein
MKYALILSVLIGMFPGHVFSASKLFQNVKVKEIRRESNGATCTWSADWLIINFASSGDSKWLRLHKDATGYKDMLSMLLTAASTGGTLNIIYDDQTSPCAAGSPATPIPSQGNLESVSLIFP